MTRLNLLCLPYGGTAQGDVAAVARPQYAGANPNPSRRIKMTSDPKGSSPPGVASPRRKRPAVTIEGTATEVTETRPPAAGAAAKEPAPAPAAPATPDSPPADAPAETLESTAAHAELAAAPALDREASGAPPETSVPPPPPPPSPNGERLAAAARDWTVLAVAGALVVLLIVAGLWLAGTFDHSEGAPLEER